MSCRCLEGTHLGLIVTSVMFCFIYIIGIPMLYGGLLYHYKMKNMLNDKQIMGRFGFLYGQFLFEIRRLRIFVVPCHSLKRFGQVGTSLPGSGGRCSTPSLFLFAPQFNRLPSCFITVRHLPCYLFDAIFPIILFSCYLPCHPSYAIFLVLYSLATAEMRVRRSSSHMFCVLLHLFLFATIRCGCCFAASSSA